MKRLQSLRHDFEFHISHLPQFIKSVYYHGMKTVKKSYLAAGAGLIGIAAFIEYLMGRKIWGSAGNAGIWSNDINSPTNSQFIADAYSFSHFNHGLLFYGLLFKVAKKLPVPVRALIAIVIEAGWEILENSDWTIERYRTQTISLNYFGDSIVNSMCDILCMLLGFMVAARVPWKYSVAIVVAIEIVMLLTIRDSLLINIIMLISPVEAIKTWQLQR